MKYWEPKARSTRAPKRGARRKKPSPSAPAKGGKRSIASGGSLRQYPFLRTFYQHQAVISDGVQKFMFFLFIATLLYAFVFGEAGLIRITKLKGERDVIAQEVALLAGNMEELNQDIERAKDDPFMMEKLGREYGLVYPGDKVYKLIHAGKNK